jgi:hypothetical protein
MILSLTQETCFLQSTYPHHKHVPPDIKHNRTPAEEMSFVQPNLPALIREISTLINSINGEMPPSGN